MLMQRPLDGPAVRVSPTGDGYRGPLPPETARAVRKLLARSLAGIGWSGIQVGQLMNASPSTISDALKPADDPEGEPEMPDDEPPGIEAPALRRRPMAVEVNAKFIARIREEYNATGDPRTRKVGQLADVQAWLDGLKPGRLESAP